VEDWVKLAIAAGSGGLAGSILTNIVNWWNRRLPRVGFRSTIYPILQPKPGDEQLSVRVTINHEGNDVVLNNLYVANVEIHNRTSTDFKSFGATIILPPEGPKILRSIRVEGSGARHLRVFTGPADLSPLTPSHRVAITLAPFHRGDVYVARVFFVVDKYPSDGAPVAEDIEVETTEIARPYRMPKVTETAVNSVYEGLRLFFPFLEKVTRQK
jgi:hypothetical protein